MVGCWVALLFSLVDPYLWIFSSRHRQVLRNLFGPSDESTNILIPSDAMNWCIPTPARIEMGPTGLSSLLLWQG